jgi:hypothetical protein
LKQIAGKDAPPPPPPLLLCCSHHHHIIITNTSSQLPGQGTPYYCPAALDNRTEMLGM